MSVPIRLHVVPKNGTFEGGRDSRARKETGTFVPSRFRPDYALAASPFEVRR
jgi:hypothetical protein